MQTETALLKRYFVKELPDGESYLDQVKWVKRDASITDGSGKVFFEQKDVEFPEGWSQQAVNIVASKFFKGPLGTDRRERSVKQLITRVVGTITVAGKKQGVLRSIEEEHNFWTELSHLLVNQYASFNSPVWFNVGVTDERSAGWCWDSLSHETRPVLGGEHRPQCSACFITSVEDNMESIMDWTKTEAMIFKGGSGSGCNVSKIRSSREFLTSGGRPSGPLPFMQINDTAAGSIKSGGKHRRAAKMVELDITHPDIFEFVRCKANEERKIRKLVESGWSNDYNDLNGAQAAAFFQNENHSVSVTDEFMWAVKDDDVFDTIGVTTGKPVERFQARKFMREIAEATHACGDPGMQFVDQMNRYNVAAGTGRIRSSNPCSEFMFIDDSSCNLASLNLMKFVRPDRTFDVEAFEHAVHVMVIAQEILVDLSSYPTEAIARNSHNLRPLGLGFANLGAYLMSQGIPYDSKEGRARASEIAALMTGKAYVTSAQLAELLGPFPDWGQNHGAANNVFDLHMASVDALPKSFFQREALALWTWLSSTLKTGWRNAQVTVIAPTGTIGFMMDCDTTGIEPELGLVKYKNLVGGGSMKIINQQVIPALQKLGYHEDQINLILAWLDRNGNLDTCPHITPTDLSVFDCALASGPSGRSIHYMGHLKMMAAVQPFISGAISKTINMPESATVEDIEAAYMQAWELGLKAVAIYRDGSKNIQPLTTKKSEAEPAKVATVDNVKDVYAEGLELGKKLGIELGKAMPFRRKLPATRNAVCHKFDINGHQGYLHVGMHDDGTPAEIFINMSKEGSTLGGLFGNLAMVISMALQYGVPLEKLIEKLKHVKYEPAGFTQNPDIRICDSIVDYIARWLELEFLKPKLQDTNTSAAAAQTTGLTAPAEEATQVTVQQATAKIVVDWNIKSNGNPKPVQGGGPPCKTCGNITVRSGTCYVCTACGETSGCS